MRLDSVASFNRLLAIAACLLLASTSTTAFAPVLLSRTVSSLHSTAVNGDPVPIVDNINITAKLGPDSLMPLAPALTFDKYMTMQAKRVIVTIQYSGEYGLNPYFLTVAKKIKFSHPDVIIEKRILPSFEEATFEIIVDDKVVVGKSSASRQRLGSNSKGVEDLTGGMSVFVSMMELDLAITKARRRRRPNTSYGSDENDSYGQLDAYNTSDDSWSD